MSWMQFNTLRNLGIRPRKVFLKCQGEETSSEWLASERVLEPKWTWLTPRLVSTIVSNISLAQLERLKVLPLASRMTLRIWDQETSIGTFGTSNLVSESKQRVPLPAVKQHYFVNLEQSQNPRIVARNADHCVFWLSTMSGAESAGLTGENKNERVPRESKASIGELWWSMPTSTSVYFIAVSSNFSMANASIVSRSISTSNIAGLKSWKTICQNMSHSCELSGLSMWLRRRSARTWATKQTCKQTTEKKSGSCKNWSWAGSPATCCQIEEKVPKRNNKQNSKRVESAFALYSNFCVFLLSKCILFTC